MAKIQEIGPYSAYAIAKKYGYQGTEEEWIKEQEANRKAAEAAAAAAAQSAKDAAASASGVAQSGQQAVQGIKDAQTAAEQAIDTAKQQAVQAAQAEAEKAATSAGQAASSAAEAAQSATNAAAEVGKVQSAGTSAVQAVQAAQNTATEAVSAAQQTATQTVSEAQATAVSAVQEAGTTQTSAVASAASSALTNISGAKDAALSDVAEAGAAQVSAIGTTGEAAVEDVNDAKTAALEAIDAANAALPAPTQSDAGKVPTVKADGSAYELAGPYAPLSATIRPTVTGNPAVCEDSAAWAFQGLAIYGKSTQDGTPSPENPVPIVSAGDGGSIDLTVCGANIFNFNSIGTLTNLNGEFVQDGGYMSCILNTQSIDSIYISGDFTLLNSNSVRVGLFNKYPEIGEIGIRMTISNSESIDVRDYNYVALSFIGSSSPTEWSQIESNFIISIGDNPIPYEPYKSQSFTIPTPTGLPGIPVTSGGNFTDADGQQWICDEVNFVNLKKISMVYKLSIKSSMPITLNSSVENFVQFTLDIGSLGIAPNMEKALLCNRFKPGSQVNEHTKEASMWIYTSTATPTKAISLAIIVPKSIASTADEFKTWISENETYVLLPLATPIENDVSAEELAAYKALTTYDGTTVVSTAEPVAGIEASYVMDGNKYRESVDKRLAALEAAQTGI